MPTQKTEFVFDKNKFLSELLSNTLLANYIDKAINVLSNPHNRDRDGNVYGYGGPMNDTVLENTTRLNPDREHIMKSLYNVYKNPDGPVATELKSFWNLVGPVFCSNRAIFEEQYLVVLKGINTFNTENQIKLLRYMFYDIDNNPNIRGNIFEEKRRQLRKNIAIMMASNPDATLEDMTNAARTTGDMKIVIDTVEMAERELDKKTKEFEEKQKASDLTIQDLQNKLANEQQKNAKLVQQLNEQQQKISKLETIIRTIKMKVGSIHANFFAGGGLVKEIQNFVNNTAKEY